MKVQDAQQHQGAVLRSHRMRPFNVVADLLEFGHFKRADETIHFEVAWLIACKHGYEARVEEPLSAEFRLRDRTGITGQQLYDRGLANCRRHHRSQWSVL